MYVSIIYRSKKLPKTCFLYLTRINFISLKTTVIVETVTQWNVTAFVAGKF